MAVDEVLLDLVSRSAGSHLTFLRFYGWKQPTLSIGYSQKMEKVVDFAFCQSHGIQVVRRLTGGKAVLHDRELTYSIISNDADHFPIHDISRTYQLIAEALSSSLTEIGIQTVLAGSTTRNNSTVRSHAYPQFACFALSNHHEILWKGRKLIGSAQRRTQRGFLQHGSILIEFDPTLLAGALGTPQLVKMESDVATLAGCLGYTPQIAEILSSFVRGFAGKFQVTFENGVLDQKLRNEIQRRMLTRQKLLD